MCNCYSYNGVGYLAESPVADPNVEIPLPGGDGKTICVDACIADVVRTLLEEDFALLGSCCGHNTAPPSLVVANGTSGVEVTLLRRRLRQLDARPWTIMRWELMAYPEKGDPYRESV